MNAQVTEVTGRKYWICLSETAALFERPLKYEQYN